MRFMKRPLPGAYFPMTCITTCTTYRSDKPEKDEPIQLLLRGEHSATEGKRLAINLTQEEAQELGKQLLGHVERLALARMQGAAPNQAALISKARWIELYGGQDLLDQEGFEVVPCDSAKCTDSVCHGWRVVNRVGQR